MITTKKGDKGQSHFSGKVVEKDSIFLEVIGSIDELQAVLELTGDENRVVDDLSQLMGRIGCESDVDVMEKSLRLEKEIEEMEKKMPEIKKFLRFKNKKALNLNWARTICRRVERRVVSLRNYDDLDSEILKYFNRLSDYLFMRACKFEKIN